MELPLSKLNFIPTVLETYEYEDIHEMIFESLPRGYNIPAVFASINEIYSIPDKTKITVFGFIDSFDIKYIKSRKSLVHIKAKLYKDGESVNLQWTTTSAKANKMVYGLKLKSPEGQLVQVSGKVSSYDTGSGFVYKFIEQPMLNTVESNLNTTDNAQFLVPEPMYKLTKDIKLLQVQNAFREVLKNFKELNTSEFLPKDLESILKMRTLEESLSYLHGLKPIPMDKFQSFLEYEGYRKRILVEKIWRIMKSSFDKTDSNLVENNLFISKESIDNIKYITESLPFTLTNDQKRAIWGLLSVFTKKGKTKSLIFGDVGSGKTMVSLVVSYVLYKLGFQCSILAPTSILAKQHYEEALKLLVGEDIFIVHSKTRKKEKDQINKFLSDGNPAIIYGTSSINKLNYTNLGIVFVDEEQKFGVHDKEFLYKNNDSHIVYMTATPIPRTLASSMYTDFEIFKIEEKPALQKPRITKVIDQLDQNEINFIKSKMNEGEQMLIIVPAIASNDLVSSKSAEAKYGKLFPEFKLTTINGRMKPINIEKNTEEFMNGNYSILIATTMVDAGFSNKNLSFVFVENADRFGIAQMHQIRGRVGRAEKQGYCYLVPAGNLNSLKDKTKDRLLSLVESENGFELSMKDIALRGSGDLRGTEQSGSEVNLLEWVKEVDIINNYLKEKNNIC